MKKAIFIFAILSIATVAKAQQKTGSKTDDWGTYNQMIKEVEKDWEDDHKFDYPTVFAYYDKAFAAVAEPPIWGGLSTALQRAKESKNKTKYEEYNNKIEVIKKKVDQNYVKEVMSFMTKVKKSDNKPDPDNYPRFVEFVKTKGLPLNYNKLSTLKPEEFQKIHSYITANEMTVPANTTMVRIPKEALDKALQNREIAPWDYAIIIDQQLQGQGKEPYYYLLESIKGKKVSAEEILKRRQTIGLEYSKITVK